MPLVSRALSQWPESCARWSWGPGGNMPLGVGAMLQGPVLVGTWWPWHHHKQQVPISSQPTSFLSWWWGDKTYPYGFSITFKLMAVLRGLPHLPLDTVVLFFVSIKKNQMCSSTILNGIADMKVTQLWKSPLMLQNNPLTGNITLILCETARVRNNNADVPSARCLAHSFLAQIQVQWRRCQHSDVWDGGRKQPSTSQQEARRCVVTVKTPKRKFRNIQSHTWEHLSRCSSVLDNQENPVYRCLPQYLNPALRSPSTRSLV